MKEKKNKKKKQNNRSDGWPRKPGAFSWFGINTQFKNNIWTV